MAEDVSPASLLGAKEYTNDIVRQAEDSEPLVRCDALLALGILGAREQVEIIATHLRDQQPFVRAYAAVGLLLMGDQKHSQGVVEVVMTELERPETVSDNVRSMAYFGARIKLHPVVAERQQALVTRTVQEWQRLQKNLQSGSRED